jgi:biotin carboxyl carrier protein
MPGTIIRYLVNEGDEVVAGDGVVILEAMKMENILPAPEDGKIVAIGFKPGDRVNTNDVLAIIA